MPQHDAEVGMDTFYSVYLSLIATSSRMLEGAPTLPHAWTLWKVSHE